MKKINIALLVASVVFATVSCENIAPQEDGSINSPSTRTLTFAAAWGDDGLTRTAIQEDGVSVYWSPNETIGIFQDNISGRFTSTNEDPAEYAVFQGELNGVADEGADFYASYPYKKTDWLDGDRIQMRFSDIQEGRAGSFADNVYPAVSKSEGGVFTFHGVCGGACFTVATEGVQCVAFNGIGQEALAGDLDIAIEEGLPVVKNVFLPKKEVLVYAPNGGTFEVGKNYYAVFVPGQLSSGLTADYYTTSGTRARATLDRSVTVHRSLFGRLTALDQGLEFSAAQSPTQIWYTTTDGQPIEHGAEDGESPLIANTYSGNTGLLCFSQPLSYVGYNQFYNKNTLQTVMLPKHMTIIGQYGFRECTNLTSVSLPDGVETIMYAAFYDCENLSSINLPSSLKLIDKWAFAYCNSLPSIIIPEGVVDLPYVSFYRCQSLASLTLPSTLRTIGENAFQYCTSLPSVVLPEGFVSIEEYAFSRCYSLTSITIPSTTSFVGNYVCWNDGALEEATVLGGMASWGIGVFQDCPRLAHFTGPYASGDGRCLIYNGSLKEFARYGLESYTIPEGVTDLSEEAFFRVANLASITLPQTLQTIGKYALQQCTGLSSITIPASVTSIGESAFWGCAGLSRIDVLATTPPAIEEWVFDNTNDAPIYVPAASLDAYKAATNWSVYADRIFAIQ